MNDEILKKARLWTTQRFDEGTRNEITALLESNNEKELSDRFYRELEFGTGGMRGIMGAGSNRMNIYTIGRATQGLANFLLDQKGAAVKTSGVSIAHDSRHNSELFAGEAAGVLAANGIHVYIFPELRPTPLLSFTVRHLKNAAGIVITASHNPKEYNGYKVYSDDGGQIVPPEDARIVEYVNRVDIAEGVKRMNYEEGKRQGLIHELDEKIETIYLEKVKHFVQNLEKGIAGELLKLGKRIKVVYTPLHGAGITLVPAALRAAGGNVEVVCEEKQSEPDGDFPTTPSPNPEEPAALSKAVSLAQKENADLVIATDPDCDRMGLAVPAGGGSFVLLNGNQIGCLLAYLIASSYKNSGILPSSPVIVSTIVTTELVHEICRDFNIEVAEVLTGFKFIAKKMREFEEEGRRHFIYGFEESYGYLADNFVRDKDGVIGAVMALTLVNYGIGAYGSIINLLHALYKKYGMYLEFQRSFILEGAEGAEKIRGLMEDLRQAPPSAIDGGAVIMIKDYLLQKEKSVKENTEHPITGLPKSNVLQFYTEDIKVSARPSGTEPKIKFYFALKMPVTGSIEGTEAVLKERYKRVSKEIFKRCGLEGF